MKKISYLIFALLVANFGNSFGMDQEMDTENDPNCEFPMEVEQPTVFDQLRSAIAQNDMDALFDLGNQGHFNALTSQELDSLIGQTMPDTMAWAMLSDMALSRRERIRQ